MQRGRRIAAGGIALLALLSVPADADFASDLREALGLAGPEDLADDAETPEPGEANEMPPTDGSAGTEAEPVATDTDEAGSGQQDPAESSD